jgi:eukaryotic-like serine/threonine-protein kinase
MQDNLLSTIGNYQIKRKLGQGGMGEVFLVFDPVCKRDIALKRIRKEFTANSALQKRFLREALIAAHLSHPSIIPIYSIHKEKEIFYTMPYVQGETLKEILKTSYEEEKASEVRHPLGSSIPTLASVFLKVCQAIAYAHSKGVLHRDLKPDNIIVGTYGEVLVFDWGLANIIQHSDEPLSQELKGSVEITKTGKVPGTLLYLAPERILGGSSSVLTDIYALGVILYQMLTLRIPFHRKTVEHVRKTLHLEKLIDPLEMAPYRDIPDHLAQIAKRCLASDPSQRFSSVTAIVDELQSYIEGRPEWIEAAELEVNRKSDWQFQENVLLAKHMAITRAPDVIEWVSLMLSRASFMGNIRIETEVTIANEGSGIGVLLAIPEAAERKGLLSEGYYLWMGSEKQPALRLFQSNVEVLTLFDFALKANTLYAVAIELEGHHLYIYLNQVLICRYHSHIPMLGTHIGLLTKDADFTLGPLKVFVGSQNAMINCLAVPDAFLASQNYSKALLEYRRIASCFSGRTEGREALFRAGLTLLEQAHKERSRKEKERLYSEAHEEFSALRFTPSAPLEFLGKSLIYKAMQEIEEEVKCLELALRKYPKHPLTKIIAEHVTFRLHESSNQSRIAAFYFLLLAIRQLPKIFEIPDNARLFHSLKAHLEPLPFLLPSDVDVHIAFWLTKKTTLIEMAKLDLPKETIENIFLALLALRQDEWIRAHSHLCPESSSLFNVSLFEPTAFSICALYQTLDRALIEGSSDKVIQERDFALRSEPFAALLIWAYLLKNEWDAARTLLEEYIPTGRSVDEYSPLYPLAGCLLRHFEGEEAALSHFSCVEIPHPPTTMLLSFYLQGKISEKKGWITTAFPWEKMQLFRQLHLYFHCAGDNGRASYFHRKMKLVLKELQK